MSHRIKLSRGVREMSLWCADTFTVVKQAPGQDFGSLPDRVSHSALCSEISNKLQVSSLWCRPRMKLRAEHRS